LISDNTISSVREQSDIVEVIRDNVRLTKRGRSWLGLCPFHKEKTPSFNVNQERGFFHCFGCGESGDSIGYLMKLEGVTFPDAVRALAERFGVMIEEDASPAQREATERKRREKADLYEIMNLAALFYEQQLAEGGHPLRDLGVAELGRRGLVQGKGDEMMDAALAAFRIGYAPYAWGGLADYFEQQGVSAEGAERLGLVVRRRGGKGYYDAFRHRLMFAVHDNSGRVVAFSGRALAEPSTERLAEVGLETMFRPRPGEESRDPPKYVNSPESPVYVKGDCVFGLFQARRAIREAAEAVIVEGNFDVMSLHARGLDRVVAPLGTAFTLAQARLIKRYAPTLVVLFDGDKAGRKATASMREPAREAGLSVKVASLPDGTDPDDFSREKGIEAVASLVKNAKGMLEHLIASELAGNDTAGWSMKDIQERLVRVAKHLGEENDPNLRTMGKTYADRLSAQLVIDGGSPADLRQLERMVNQALAGGGRAKAERPSTRHASPELGPRARSQPQVIAQAHNVLGALLDCPELLDDPEVETGLGELSGEAALAALTLRQHWESKNTVVSAELLDLLPQAIHSFAVGRLAAPRFAEATGAKAEILTNLQKIRSRSLTGDKTVKVQELARADGQGDVEAQDTLLRELERVARRKRGLS
jgi:DNA primase